MGTLTGKSYALMVVMINMAFSASGQLLIPGLDFQSAMISNPAFTGSEGNGILRLSYQDLYPGNNFNLHSVSLSYDGYFQTLHGGAGFYISDNYLGGLVNDLKGGMAYSYYFQAGPDLYIGSGLSASFFHRGFNSGGAILPDQIDPVYGVVYPSSEVLSMVNKTVPDLGTGFLIITRKLFLGIAVNHLAQPDIGTSDVTVNKLYRQLVLYGSGEISLNKEKNLVLKPLARIDLSKGAATAGTGAVVESNHLAVNAALITGNDKSLDLVSGFSISLGKLLFYYNYRFNIVSRENLLPVSVMHNTGLALSLNNVDKRKTVKTINFPKL
jgi:type IX secretion system PorP/SprF family membrane protein